ncbi:NAD dependent epimerase/dehydratase [Canariomyces notabilis]|uniref:NAD dependent epimerase/dehydratase n=1 Tax=Canariomyces notabilis TaxID=2074819 RepID=A0AAN6QHE2_9PEZI|nr:NAD dependent epimerase/dehydratase [Canariomyces arenarius]
MPARTALVTGGSGYIGLHVVNSLLEAGWTVHATVRNLQNGTKAQPLKSLADKHPGKLRLFAADLLVADSFTEAMQGCSTVIHVASPFLVPDRVKNPDTDLIQPALEGTRNVLESVNKTESVKRVVLTSSVGAMYGDAADVLQYENATLHEGCWNTTSSISHNAYQYSKTLAEKEAWKIAESQDRWDLVVICPGLVLGPSLSPASDSGSLALIDQLLSGLLMVGVPALSWAVVDVRDVAAAHVRAAEVPEAKGRYIVAESKTTSCLDLSKSFKRLHSKPLVLPTWTLPALVFRLFAPFAGVSQMWVTRNWGIDFSLDNSRGTKEFGIKYRPVEEMLRDHYEAWVAQH